MTTWIHLNHPCNGIDICEEDADLSGQGYIRLEELRKIVVDKPSWSEAPVWANWLCRDSYGNWHWHENKPRQLKTTWLSKDNHRVARYAPLDFWGDSLEERPE